ncbi:hypothetical protein [Dactylosporangium sp. NPDC005555]|uniref:hypothetical protein n=1 Tax=Dactylosporangium sp. NPDC005555 TaxID=3154889 RepID=UPI0033A4B017
MWEIATGYVHAHLIEVDDGLVLVDTGLPRKVTNAAQSVAARLADLDFQVAVFGHGAAVTGDAVSRFRDYAGRRR